MDFAAAEYGKRMMPLRHIATKATRGCTFWCESNDWVCQKNQSQKLTKIETVDDCEMELARSDPELRGYWF
jgi:hypothetical protein